MYVPVMDFGFRGSVVECAICTLRTSMETLFTCVIRYGMCVYIILCSIPYTYMNYIRYMYTIAEECVPYTVCGMCATLYVRYTE